MKRSLFCVLLLSACDGDAGKAPATLPKPVTTTPKAVDADPPAKTSEPEPAALEEPIEAEWIVWFQTKDAGPQSRWYTKTASGVTMTVSRKAVALGNGTDFWQLRRADAKADVFDCACVESERDPMCRKTGEIVTLGLEAVPAGGGDPVALETASDASVYGEVDMLTLALHGGVGSKVFVETGDSGYYCGAHGSYGGVISLRDPSAKTQPSWPKLELPGPMLRQAAVSDDMLDSYKECWNEPITMEAFIKDVMKVVSVEMSLDRGLLQLRWNTEADGPYACTADYAFHGYVNSNLLPSADALGLAPPLPGGLQDAFKDIGTATVVGWSPVEPAAREATLTWFRGLDETPWPKGMSEQTSTATDVTPAQLAERRKWLEQGRKLTREKDYTGAVKVLTEAIVADPGAARPLAARCYAHLLAKSYPEARKDCDKALTLHPGERFAASVHYNLGQIAEGEGKPRQAKKAYETSLTLRENATVRKALEAVK